MKDVSTRAVRGPGRIVAGRGPALLGAALLVGGLAAASAAAPAVAGETTLQLIEIMRDNGTITPAQYQRLRAAAARDEQHTGGQPTAQSNPQAKSVEQQVQQRVDEKFADYEWASKIKLKGDIRLRYQFGDNDARVNANGEQIDRHRGRVRYRLGVIATPLDDLEVGAGLASGGADPRSTNQTFDNTFSSKGINLDYAYAQYRFNDHFKAIAGKFDFDDYLWIPTDLTWDGDIRVEGTSAEFSLDNALGETFVNGGIWVLNEFSNRSNDPYVYYGQIGQHFGSGNVFGTVSGIYYGYENTDITDADGNPIAFDPRFSAGTNTDNQFNVVSGNGELGTHFMGDRAKVSLVGEYVVNTETNTDADTGFSIGAKAGIDKWAFKYIYADLDANAVPDSFPDSDRFGGATDIRGHEVALAYALVDNVELGLDYYNVERKSTGVDEQILQTDLVINF